jgi:acyl carrier protein
MRKQEILDRINEIIVDEKGQALTIDQNFLDSELDSLGVMIVIITLDAEFPIFKDIPEDDQIDYLDIPNLTMRDLVAKCRLSITNTDTEQN